MQGCTRRPGGAALQPVGYSCGVACSEVWRGSLRPRRIALPAVPLPQACVLLSTGLAAALLVKITQNASCTSGPPQVWPHSCVRVRCTLHRHTGTPSLDHPHALTSTPHNHVSPSPPPPPPPPPTPQVGQQDVALGLRFCARVVLRIREWPAGVPAQLLARSPNRRSAAGGGGAAGRVAGFWPFSGGASSSGSSGWGWPAGASSGSGSGWDSGGGSSGEEEAGAWSERRFLRPRSPLAGSSPMDLSFELCEGDFAVRGVGWGRGLLERIVLNMYVATTAACVRQFRGLVRATCLPRAWCGRCTAQHHAMLWLSLVPACFSPALPCRLRRPTARLPAAAPSRQAFRGLWRMQPAPDGAACRLSYTLFVRPQPWLPVGLVEARVAAEIRGNLAAVATHVEGLV